ncbi:hypothetical protein [Flavobacterium silvisoli]|nr:hypothetical protein [Flavobacterium silvisoli]
MNKKQYIKIPLPRWWQTAIIFAVIILAFRVDATAAWEFLKICLKTRLEK